ncbi:hypothetical protein QFC24_000151 [Naganishia onofrii]|uniref:Uncharacterized protein n=1 Tax=Naganishia onofrii TaxID=1851511 RepID=A0ACC2XV79_9TREE|nr:hypothetical protein QFC24_000151 [Naganishia onofrii]
MPLSLDLWNNTARFRGRQRPSAPSVLSARLLLLSVATLALILQFCDTPRLPLRIPPDSSPTPTISPRPLTWALPRRLPPRFPARQEYVPTVFENLCKLTPSPLDPTKTVELALWDTAGQEDFDRIRPLSYAGVDVVLIVFAVNYRTSLDNVVDKWAPEISHFTPSTPLLLIGTKIDLRASPTELGLLRAQGTSPITASEGDQVAKEIGARGYLECSALTGEGVQEVFREALRICLKGRAGRKRDAGASGSSSGGGERRKRNCVVL